MKKVFLMFLLVAFFSSIIVSCTPDNVNENTELATGHGEVGDPQIPDDEETGQ